MGITSFELIMGFVVLGIAAFALGWNMHHNYAGGRKLKISGQIVDQPKNKSKKLKGQYIVISILNQGTKNLKIVALWAANISFFRKLFLKGYGKRLRPVTSFQLPAEIGPGEKVELLLPFHEDCFLKEKFNKLGIMDSYDREIWIPDTQLSGFYKEYEKDFR